MSVNSSRSRPDFRVWDSDQEQMFREFSHRYAQQIAPDNPVPDSLDQWRPIAQARRTRLLEALGSFPAEPTPLEPQIVGRLQRSDHVVEKVLLQTRPNVVMTANLYLPKDLERPAPAVLCVHGHWKEGKAAGQVQQRNLGLVRCGFVVLSVDAIGAGERNYRGQMYHGLQLGAQVLPSGLTLAGLQVWDNRRALDYLCSRPEVDPRRLACTGASGGCNQTIYVSAVDERIQAVAPVCCVGSFAGYLNGAHCVCEMVPGIRRFAEMGDILALIAPRALMIINGIHDMGAGFRVEDMRRQFPKLARVYELYGARDRLAKFEVDMGHGYYRPMREAMYAWFRRWLQGVQADLCPEPEDIEPAPREHLLCLAPRALEQGMPETYASVPALAYREGRRLVESAPRPSPSEPDVAAWRAHVRQRLEQECFGGFPPTAPTVIEAGTSVSGQSVLSKLVVESEPGIRVPLVMVGAASAGRSQAPGVLWLDPDGKAASGESAGVQALVAGGHRVALADLRGVGETHWPQAELQGVWDYQLFQNSMILGRPLLGMWVWDALQCLRVLRERYARVVVAGRGVFGLVALVAAVFDEEVTAVVCDRMLGTYLWPEGFTAAHPMGTFVPGLLKVADIPGLAGLIAPRRLRLIAPVDGAGAVLNQPDAERVFAPTRAVYQRLGAAGHFLIEAEPPSGHDEGLGHWLRDSCSDGRR